MPHLLGLCDDPKTPEHKREMVFREGQTGLDFMDTVVHEVLHALDFSWSEQRVTGAARDLSKFLWRLGYRKVDDPIDDPSQD